MRHLDLTDHSLATKLRAIVEDSDVFEETLELSNRFSDLKVSRSPFYLTAIEFDEILQWKLDSQYPRSRELRRLNLDSVVVPVTQAVFAVASESFEYEVDLKLKMLSSIRGVATPIASAVLALTDPDKFAVIDSVLWEAIYGEEKQAFSSRDYLKFLEVIRKIAMEADLNMQSAEHAIWIHLIN